ncbi:hypothetical protein [Virgisporangium aliadipatigenens]|uniref:hypothetical protein n=1 Tax=Virgisporangium aliadipatigenens TaxID=741659 RepID=UPI001944ABDC|nr:hypothetical protein [Virgisporangium aliadipatigenens]
MRRAVTLLLVALLAGCTATPPAPKPSAGPPAPPAPPPAGGQQPFGAHWDPNRHQQFEPYLRSISGSATYHELTWCEVEKEKGRPDWSDVDRVAERTRALGITLNLKIRVGMCWATDGTAEHVRGQAGKTESAMPRDLAAYASFVDGVVRRYAAYGVPTYAVENEVNSQSYWSGSAADYERLVTTAARAIRAADPKAKVADSGISSVGYGFGVVDRLLRDGKEADAVAAYRAYFARRIGTRGQQIPDASDAARLRTALATDADRRHVEFLAVTEKLLADKVVDVRQVHYYEPFDGVPALLDYLRARTPQGTPVQAWEVGQFWRDGEGDDVRRSQEMVKTVAQLVAGGLGPVMWLPLAYNPDNKQGSEVRYGLLDPDGKTRLAGTVFAALASEARGASVEVVSGKGLTGVAFRKGGASALVVWASGGPVKVPAADGLTAAVLGSGEPKAGAVEVGEAPVLIRTPRAPAEVLATVRG